MPLTNKNLNNLISYLEQKPTIFLFDQLKETIIDDHGYSDEYEYSPWAYFKLNIEPYQIKKLHQLFDEELSNKEPLIFC